MASETSDPNPEGMRRIFQLMQISELAEPEILSVPEAFTVVLRNRPVYKAEHQLWLGEFARFNLSREQKAIVVLGYGGRLISANDIWTSLGLEDTERYRQLVSSLQKLNVLVTEVRKEAAQRQARTTRVNVRDIPRFRIGVPLEDAGRGRVRPTRPRRRARRSGNGRPSAQSNIVDRSDIDSFNVDARVFIGNLPFKVEHASLLALFADRGFSADIYVPEIRGVSKGYGFAQFDTPEMAVKARTSLDGIEFLGRHLVLRPALRRNGR